MDNYENIDQQVNSCAKKIAQESYGRLLSLLCVKFNDISLAEDILSESFAKALINWKKNGIPKNPVAWILTVARNKGIDSKRSSSSKLSVQLDEGIINSYIEQDALLGDDIPDKRLELMFVCAHPAIDVSIRTPLMLQTVLGIDAKRIAKIYNISSDSMAQRLVRAKTKIKQANIAFKLPKIDEMKTRLNAVIEAIYGGYTIHCDCFDTIEINNDNNELMDEIIFLSNILCELLPNEAEVLGLNALIKYTQSRAGAKLDNYNNYVPIEEQDINKWDKYLIDEAEVILKKANQINIIGRFQLEAAINSVHSQRIYNKSTNWHAICKLYDGLISISPNLGAYVAKAVALSNIGFASEGLNILQSLENESEHYQPAAAAKAYLYSKLGKLEEAKKEYDIAIMMTNNDILKRYLTIQKNNL